MRLLRFARNDVRTRRDCFVVSLLAMTRCVLANRKLSAMTRCVLAFNGSYLAKAKSQAERNDR